MNWNILAIVLDRLFIKIERKRDMVLSTRFEVDRGGLLEAGRLGGVHGVARHGAEAALALAFLAPVGALQASRGALTV